MERKREVMHHRKRRRRCSMDGQGGGCGWAGFGFQGIGKRLMGTFSFLHFCYSRGFSPFFPLFTLIPLGKSKDPVTCHLLQVSPRAPSVSSPARSAYKVIRVRMVLGVGGRRTKGNCRNAIARSICKSNSPLAHLACFPTNNVTHSPCLSILSTYLYLLPSAPCVCG